MLKETTCILCPNSCTLKASLADGKLLCISGAKCVRGERHFKQELENPMRLVTSSVKVTGGSLPLVSVRLTKPIPKGRIFDVMNQIRELCVAAPVSIGETLLSGVAGLDSDLITTKAVPALENE